MEDLEIIELYFRRDESAITETDRKYGRRMKNNAFQIVREYEDAKECVNDTLLKAWTTIPPVRPVILFAYLSSILRTIALNLYNHRHAQKRFSDTYAVSLEELGDCVSGIDNVSAKFDEVMLGEEISAFLKKQPERNRKLFVCRYFWFDSLKEAASACGMSESAARTALFRMRRSLKEYLKERGYDI
ncbi:MAG: RNA polymerase sigma factor [Solobacterium sp.]|nr:RNA polymerase sigma factor [Solobacterium sp.]